MAESSHQKALNIAQKITEIGKQRQDQLKEEGFLTGLILNRTHDLATAATAVTKDGVVRNGVSEKYLGNTLKSLKASEKQSEAIQSTFPGLISMANSADSMAKSVDAFLPGFAKFGGIAIGAVLAFVKIQEAITNTRKELGVSAVQAAIVTAQTKALGFAAKAYGLDVEDIKSAQAAIRNDLGASVQESVKLSLNFARTAAATGQTSDELTGTLSIMESISSASRDVLLNQIRTNAAIIGQAGVSPALVMKDLAQNAEFFAQFAKDGGGNIIQAGIAARKLGLEMSAVAGISESLLNFESSIESQLEASMLLGRQINLDKARQLAFTGDQEGMMKEILKQVGGEVEFNKMNVIQRKALAESVGVNVEQLSRLVRNNTAGGTAGAVGAAVAGGTNVYSDPTSHEYLRKLVRNTE
jgi:hypothetical protein